MTDRNEQHPVDELDRATEALRNAPIPDGPSPNLVASTVEALQSASIAPPSVSPPSVGGRYRGGLSQRRRKMFRLVRYSTAAAAVMLLAVLAGWLFLIDHPLAFADVVEQVKKAKSVTFVTKMPSILQGREKGILQQKFYIQGDASRMEIPSAQEGVQVPPDAPPVLLAFIADAKQKKALQLDFVRKTAQIMKVDEKRWQEMAKGLANPVEQLRQLKDQEAERIGEEVLDGRKTQVYRLKKTDIFMGVRVTEPEVAKVWVDPKTSLPVRIAVERPADGGKVETVFSFEQFTWNESLDPDLFKLEVPKGFTVTEE
jgi:hypothetical protein